MSYYGKGLSVEWPVDFMRSSRNEQISGTWTFNNAVTFKGVSTFTNTIQGTALKALYADLAERYKIDISAVDSLEGYIVSMAGSEEITLAKYPMTPFGVISTDPSFMMNSEAGDDKEYPYVCVAGRVPCIVTGKVNKHDKIVLSELDGIGRAYKEGDNDAYIIGVALESSNDENIKKINIVTTIKAN